MSCTTGALFLSAALIVPMRVQALAERPGAYNCGEDGGGAEAGWIFHLYWDAKQGKLWLGSTSGGAISL